MENEVKQVMKNVLEIVVKNAEPIYKPAWKKPKFREIILIGFALLMSPSNQELGSLDIYNFIERWFPYYSTTPTHWKMSFGYILSTSKYFTNVPGKYIRRSGRKGFVWTFNRINSIEYKAKWEKSCLNCTRELDNCLSSRKIFEKLKLVGLYKDQIQLY